MAIPNEFLHAPEANERMFSNLFGVILRKVDLMNEVLDLIGDDADLSLLRDTSKTLKELDKHLSQLNAVFVQQLEIDVQRYRGSIAASAMHIKGLIIDKASDLIRNFDPLDNDEVEAKNLINNFFQAFLRDDSLYEQDYDQDHPLFKFHPNRDFAPMEVDQVGSPSNDMELG